MAYLRLNISNLCNFSCKYCHVFKLVENKAPMKVMDYETMCYAIEHFIEIIRKHNENSLTLSIYGGEPLINKHNLFRVIEKYQNTYNGIGIEWFVNTNGSLLTEEVADFFKEHNVDVHLSADGFKEIHNMNRVDKFGKGTFDRVEKALSLIKQNNLKAQINSFVFPENINNLIDIVNLAKKYGIRRIYLDLFYDSQNREIRSGTMSAKYFEAYAYGLKNGVHISGPWTPIFKRYTRKNEAFDKKRVPTIDVTVEGRYFFKCSPRMEPLTLDKLNDNDFISNWKQNMEQFRALVDNNCKYCFLKKSCDGRIISQFQYHTRLSKGWKHACISTQEIIKAIKKEVSKNDRV